jgi:predicted amidophosphoribosyltransferase
MRRGFDPAVLLGRELARRLGVPFERGLRMRRSTRPQKSLTAAQRRENLRGAFRLRSRGMRGRNILLVDDIATTGATLREASRVLVGAGAVVWAASVAMTPERALDMQGRSEPEAPAQG